MTAPAPHPYCPHDEGEPCTCASELRQQVSDRERKRSRRATTPTPSAEQFAEVAAAVAELTAKGLGGPGDRRLARDRGAHRLPGTRQAGEGGVSARLIVVPTIRDEAFAFIAARHRHHPPPTGYLFAAAVADEHGTVVGVATAGRPVARALQDGWTFEVTRTCTDGTPNANSALYGAVWRAGRALGYRLAVTYTQDGEAGASLRAAGWVVADDLPARAGWDMPGRRRTDKHPVGVGRTRWEIRADVPPWATRPRVPVAQQDALPDLLDGRAG